MLLLFLLVDINHVVLLWLNVEQQQSKRMPSGWYGSGDENEINTNNQSNEMRMSYRPAVHEHEENRKSVWSDER